MNHASTFQPFPKGHLRHLPFVLYPIWSCRESNGFVEWRFPRSDWCMAAQRSGDLRSYCEEVDWGIAEVNNQQNQRWCGSGSSYEKETLSTNLCYHQHFNFHLLPWSLAKELLRRWQLRRLCRLGLKQLQYLLKCNRIDLVVLVDQ